MMIKSIMEFSISVETQSKIMRKVQECQRLVANLVKGIEPENRVGKYWTTFLTVSNLINSLDKSAKLDSLPDPLQKRFCCEIKNHTGHPIIPMVMGVKLLLETALPVFPKDSLQIQTSINILNQLKNSI